MNELVFLLSALAGAAAWLWVGYREYLEAKVETAPPEELSDPRRALLSGLERRLER